HRAHLVEHLLPVFEVRHAVLHDHRCHVRAPFNDQGAWPAQAPAVGKSARRPCDNARVDWGDVRFFLAAARCGSLGAAARELGVEHTTVSRRLGALEDALGAKLFARTPDGLALTPAGAEVLPLAESIEQAAQAIERS